MGKFSDDMLHTVEEKAKAKLKEASKQELAKAKDELKAKIPTKERRAKIVREFTDIDKIKKEVRYFGENVVRGFKLCAEGCVTALRDEHVRHTYVKHLKPLAIMTVAAFVVVKLLFLPIHLTIFLLSFLFAFDENIYDRMDDRSNDIIFLLPFLYIMAMRYVFFKPLEDVFFDVLMKLDPEFGTKLRSMEPWPAAEAIRKSAARTRHLLAIGVIFSILSWLPLIGVVVMPLADYYLLKKKLGLKMSAISFAFMLIGFKHQVLTAMGYYVGSRFLGREVLEPYLSRAKMTDEEQRKFLKKQDAVIIGFSLPLYLAICLPYIGPIFFGLAFAAAGALVAYTHTLAPVHLVQ